MKKTIKDILVLSLAVMLGIGLLTGCGAAVAPAAAPEPKEEAAPAQDVTAETEDEYYDEEEYIDEDENADDAGMEDEDIENEPYEGADPIGKWYTEDYDEEANWATSYVIELTEDGKATCTGWRNKDTGTFSTDKETVTIVFDDCQVDEAGEGFKPVEDFSYTIKMELHGDDADITVDAPDTISNLENCTVHREEGLGDDLSDSDAGEGTDVADGEYLTDGKYSGEISEDGATVTIETALGHYDKDWNMIRDYDKQIFVFSTSADCKFVSTDEESKEYPVSEQIEWIGKLLKGTEDIPLGLVIKNNELVEINVSS